MAKINFYHQSPPIFQKRQKAKKTVLIFKFTFAIAFLVLIIAFGLSIYDAQRQKTDFKPVTQVFRKPATPSEIAAVIVPHHDLVKNERQKLFQEVAKIDQSIKTVILISPNHFNSGSGAVITTKKNWQLATNQIKPNNKIIDDLITKKLATDEEAAFTREHGISNLLGEINKYFPKATIVPIIIKETVTKDQIIKLTDEIALERDPNTLLISSVDFSHYQPAALAELHDEASIRALKNKDLDTIWQNIEVDSPPSLFIAAQLAKKQKLEFSLFDHTNSGIIEKNRDAETTTHVFGYYGSLGRDMPRHVSTTMENSTTFIFTGDMMFDRMINHQFPDNKIFDIFSNFGNRVFWGTDMAIANNEGPISDQPISDDITPNNLSFNFPPKTGNALKWLHLDAVSLANNHTLNAGSAGFETTKNILEKNKIAYFGHQNNFGDFSVFRSTRGDIPVSVIGINTLPGLPKEEIERIIKQEKKGGQFVIMMPHWGAEYQPVHSRVVEGWAKEWISWGADLIIGSHPHVVQDAQMIDGVPVFYSLGNFVFDQTFSQETQQGLVIAGKITKNQIEIIPLPTKQVNLKPELVRGEEKTKTINKYINELGLTDQKASTTDLGSIVIQRK